MGAFISKLWNNICQRKLGLRTKKIFTSQIKQLYKLVGSFIKSTGVLHPPTETLQGPFCAHAN